PPRHLVRPVSTRRLPYRRRLRGAYFARRLTIDGRNGECHRKRRALSLALAIGANRAAVQLDQVPDYREPEPEPAVASRRGRVGLTEAVEDVREKLRAHARARVAHTY